MWMVRVVVPKDDEVIKTICFYCYIILQLSKLHQILFAAGRSIYTPLNELNPPSTGITFPVTKLEESLHRN